MVIENLDQALTIIGCVAVLWLLLKSAFGFILWLRTYVLSRVWKGVDVSHYGPWAVITGGSAGIGKAYAHELAKRGLDVILISLYMDELEEAAAEIEKKHGRRTKVIQVDFTHGPEIYEKIRDALQGLEIGILVNNVGVGLGKVHDFLGFPNLDKYIHETVSCNMVTTVKMTQMILPQMVARKKGIIINLSSEAGRNPLPLYVVYSASKAFVDFFSRGLEKEYHTQGIIVQSVLPSYVATDMTKEYYNSWMTTPEGFVPQALNTVGITERSSGCLSHAVAAFFINLIPLWIKLSPASLLVMNYITKKMKKEK